jgi:hypothetical protein
MSKEKIALRKLFPWRTNCTEMVQSEVSLCPMRDSQSYGVLFHTVFNRAVENFYTPFTFLDSCSSKWRLNCLAAVIFPVRSSLAKFLTAAANSVFLQQSLPVVPP